MNVMYMVQILLFLLLICKSLTYTQIQPPYQLMWVQTSNPSSGSDIARAVAVDSTGLYVVGYDKSPGDYQWRIEKRRLDDGTIIWVQTSNPSSGSDIACAVAVDSTGLYVVGYDYSPGDYQWRIEKRRLDDGTTIWVQTSNPSSS